MYMKKINDKGGTSIVLVIICLILLSVCLYNANMAKTSYSTVNYKYQLDSIIKKRLINVIDLDDLKDYKFGDGTIYYKYNDNSKSMSKNFDTTSPDYINFKNNLISSIENEFSSNLSGVVKNIKFNTSHVTFNYNRLQNNSVNLDRYVVTLSYKYVVFMEVPINENSPIEVDRFVLNDLDVSGGKIVVSKSHNDPGIANVAISGKVAIRYSIDR